MRKRNRKLYWKFSELSFGKAKELSDAYDKLRNSGHNPLIRQTDEKILLKFISTIAYRKMPMSELAKESLRTYYKTGVGVGKSYYYVDGSKISYKLVGSDWDIVGDVGHETYEEAVIEKNVYLCEMRRKKVLERKSKWSDLAVSLYLNETE